MKIDVTELVNAYVYHEAYAPLVGNQYELGNNAAQITWKNAVDYSSKHPILKTAEEIEAARKHFKEYGAWSEEELASDETIQAMACQEVHNVIWEHRNDETFDFEDFTDDRLYKCDVEGHAAYGRWFFYFGA